MTTANSAAPGLSSITHAHRSLAGRCFSFPIVIAALLAAIVYLLVPQNIGDPDIWWHLRNAEYLIQARAFVTRDMFSYTASGAPWINHEWLAELPFYFAWKLMGGRGLFLVTLTAVETIFLFVFYLSYRKSTALIPSLLVSTVAAILSTVSFGPRTLLFGWICLTIELVVLEHFKTSPRLIFTLPLLFVIWVNTHGSWLIGIVLLALFVVSDLPTIRAGEIENIPSMPLARRQLHLAGCLCIFAIFLNPYGWRLVAYPFNLVFRQTLNLANIEEWRTLDFHSPRAKILLVSLALLFIAQLLQRRKWAVYELIFLFIGVYAAVTYTRFLFLAAILVFPLMTESFVAPSRSQARLRKARVYKPWANAFIIFGLATFIFHYFPSTTKLDYSNEKRFPTDALSFLGAFKPEGNVLNDFLWGGFLIWHARQIPVMIDSRIDIFEYNGVFRDYLDAVQLRNSVAILDKYKVRYVIFAKNAPLVYLLEHTDMWKIDYEDKTTTVLERRPTDHPRFACKDAKL